MKKYFLFFGLVLAGCGFQPMYTDNVADIYVSPISGINGIDLRNNLTARFGGPRNSDAEYTLNIKLNEPITKYKALEQTGDATWQEIQIVAKYKLLRGETEITSGSESASESYMFVSYLVAANASYNNAVQNTIKLLSDKIGARVIAESHRYEQTEKDK